MTFLIVLLSVGIVWCMSVTLAWAINRPELKREYRKVPFNWRVFGYFWAYIPYLKRINNYNDGSNY